MSHPTFSSPLSEAWPSHVDGPSPEFANWSSTITPLSPTSPSGVALIGFASGEGVVRNGGRPGAQEGPDAIRQLLGPLTVHAPYPLYDAGTVPVIGTDLEGGQDVLSDAVADITRSGHLPIVLGGGHDTAFGSWRGLAAATGSAADISILNLDAHFDLRQADPCNNGTPLRQIAESAGDAFDYSVLGISPPNNSTFLFNSAREFNVTVLTDDQVNDLTPSAAADLALDLTAGRRHIHLSIDLDVLPAAEAPGVSAPAAVGVALRQVRAVALALARSGRLALVDVVELNPSLDIDDRTARIAARLVNDIAQAYLTAR